MVLYPEVQKRAQAEVDIFLKGERLPDFNDRTEGKTPYLEAIISEVLRWNPVTPLGTPRITFKWYIDSYWFPGVAHAVTEHDNYGGYFIPKGTVMLPNQWYVIMILLIFFLQYQMCFALERAILHDPVFYPDPLAFNPERFLGSDIKDPRTAAFGFGRR